MKNRFLFTMPLRYLPFAVGLFYAYLGLLVPSVLVAAPTLFPCLKLAARLAGVH